MAPNNFCPHPQTASLMIWTQTGNYCINVAACFPASILPELWASRHFIARVLE
jgi:hypothetical protein